MFLSPQFYRTVQEVGGVQKLANVFHINITGQIVREIMLASLNLTILLNGPL